MSSWRLHADYQHLAEDFGGLQQVFALEGEQITRDHISDLIRVQHQGVDYYVKRYRRNAQGWRNWLPRIRTRIRAEWENLQYFTDWKIATAEVIARGEKTKGLFFIRGAMITRGIPNALDLEALTYDQSPLLQDADWVDEVSRQIADFTRIMHRQRFTHNDLKWRNILVDDQRKVFLIDCPAGSFWRGPLLRYRIIKDLACLDKVGKYQLSRTQRLRFYLYYVQRPRLNAADKARIAKIEHFFAGRE